MKQHYLIILCILTFLSIVQLKAQTKSDLLVSEIMSKPEKGGAEFIEFYNPTSAPISIDGVSFGILKNGVVKRSLSLKGVMIPSKTFIVLTNDKEAILQSYPKADKGKVFFTDGRLPRLADKGFDYVLYRDDKLIDKGSINNSYYPRGFKSKKGISLERVKQGDKWSWKMCVDPSGATPSYGYDPFIPSSGDPKKPDSVAGLPEEADVHSALDMAKETKAWIARSGEAVLVIYAEDANIIDMLNTTRTHQWCDAIISGEKTGGLTKLISRKVYFLVMYYPRSDKQPIVIRFIY